MRKKSILYITATLIVVLIGLQILVSHKLSVEGFTLTQLTMEYQSLERSNEILSHKIASASSYITIKNRAKELGFEEAEVRRIERPPVAMR